MVENILMRCEVCKSVIQFKWQVGHFERTPVSLVCPECKTILKFVLITDQRKITIDLESKNVVAAERGDVPIFFAETSSELLTQKISNQMLLPGFTPFIRTSSMLGEERFEKYRVHVSKGMNAYKNKLHIYKRLNDLYYNNTRKYFTDELLKNLFKKNEGQELKEIEIIEGLYQYNINFYNHFAKHGRIEAINEEILKLFKEIRDNHNSEYERFLSDCITDELILDYDKRIYKSINHILENYPYLLPATILSYFSKSKRASIYESLTITTTNFEDVKNIYISVYENIMVVYEVLLLLNNIILRGNFEKFDTNIIIDGKKINTINQFRKLSKGHRLAFLNNRTHFDCIMPEFDRKIRNAIGHEMWEYEPFEHKVLFEHDDMFVLEFVFECWNLYESLIGIYKVIQDIKRHRQLTINNIS